MDRSTTQVAHQTVDDVADRTTEQINRLAGTAHRAVDRAADVAGSALTRARETQTRLADAACVTIRARPLVSVAGVFVVGYLLGRLARW